ncbi:MAG: DUF3293 domain-containing protein [Chloroflexota bacterium]
MIAKELIEAYYATEYRVQLPTGTIGFRADEPTSGLNEFAASRGATSWAFITAYNPYSQLLPLQENENRQNLLKDVLSMSGYEFYAGEGVGDSTEWPPEPSLFILGLSCQKAMALGMVFEQNALIFCEATGKPEILFCE